LLKDRPDRGLRAAVGIERDNESMHRRAPGESSMVVSGGVCKALDTGEPQTLQTGLEHEKDRLKLLLDMTNALVSNLEPRDLLRAISASIRQDMHCDLVGVWLPDSNRRQLRQLVMDFPESRGFVKEGLLRHVEGSFVGGPFKTGKPVVGTMADFM